MSVLHDLAARIDALAPGRRVRVAVDGVDCAGKTALADALAGLLQREVVRTSVDDHPDPPEVRYRLGRESAEGCYRDATDLALPRRRVLDPRQLAVVEAAPADVVLDPTDLVHPVVRCW